MILRLHARRDSLLLGLTARTRSRKGASSGRSATQTPIISRLIVMLVLGREEDGSVQRVRQTTMPSTDLHGDNDQF